MWWNAEILRVATHEKVHVDNGRTAANGLNSALKGNTCSAARRKQTTVFDDWKRADCEFDMKEYGSELGLSLKRCLAQ